MRALAFLITFALSGCIGTAERAERQSIHECTREWQQQVGYGTGDCAYVNGKAWCPESMSLRDSLAWSESQFAPVLDPCEERALKLFAWSGAADAGTTVVALACGARELNPALGGNPSALLLLGLQYFVYREAVETAKRSDKFHSSAEAIEWLSYIRLGAATWNASVIGKACF